MLIPAPVVSAIHIYPVKSCGGIAQTEATLDTWGFQYDRNWMVIQPDGRFMTQRHYPRLALVTTALDAHFLRLTAPGQPELQLPLELTTPITVEVTVWRDRCLAMDQGNAAATWFSEFLGLDCRLVRMTPGFNRPVDSTYASVPAQVNFADGFPLLLISEASLADLNGRLVEPLSMNRFRPNLVVAGCVAFAEDTWLKFQIGSVVFEGVKRCTRCTVTTVDQSTGIPGQEPLVTLANYRRLPGGLIFGQNVVHRSLGTLHVGDPIEILSTSA